MKSLTFKRQIVLGIIFIIAGNFLAFSLQNGIFANAAWMIYGLLFLFHPVYPAGCEVKKGKLSARIAGIVCVIVGLLTRFYV